MIQGFHKGGDIRTRSNILTLSTWIKKKPKTHIPSIKLKTEILYKIPPAETLLKNVGKSCMCMKYMKHEGLVFYSYLSKTGSGVVLQGLGNVTEGQGGNKVTPQSEI